MCKLNSFDSVSARISEYLVPFEVAVRKIQSAAQRSLNSTCDEELDEHCNRTIQTTTFKNSWPVCCTLGVERQDKSDHRSPARFIEDYREDSQSDYEDWIQRWSFQQDCTISSLESIRGFDKCLCNSMADTTGNMKTDIHNWDSGVMRAFKSLYEDTKLFNVSDINDLPLMFIGTKEGVFTQFPAFDNPEFRENCYSYDPRIRDWYSQFTLKQDRQFIILQDRSTSMENVSVNGRQYESFLQIFIELFLKSLKTTDLVQIFSFGASELEELEIELANNCFITSQQLLAQHNKQNIFERARHRSTFRMHNLNEGEIRGVFLNMRGHPGAQILLS